MVAIPLAAGAKRAVVDEQRPPQLSPSGAQILSEVLARRNAEAAPTASADEVSSRHDTPTSRANAARRSRSSLRAKPFIDVFDVGAERVSDESVVEASTSRALSVLLAGMALGAIVVGLTLAFAPRLNEPGVEVAGAVEDQPREPLQTSTGLVPVEFDASSVEVAIFDVGVMVDGVQSLAMELTGQSTDREIRTDEFTVIVEQADGTPVLTFVRFEAEYLQVGSSAAATVRAEGGNSGQLYVVVRLGGLLIDRIALA